MSHVEDCRVFFGEGEFLQAILAAERGISSGMDVALCWQYMAYCYICLGLIPEAEFAFTQAKSVEAEAPTPVASIGLGDLAIMKGDARTALRHYRTASLSACLSLQEEINLEYILRSAGQFRQASRQTEWQQFRSRTNAEYYPRGYLEPRWRGESLAGKSLLVHWADGLGDNLLNIRFLSEIAAAGAALFLDCPAELYRLFKYSFPMWKTYSAGRPLPGGFDFHTSVLALAGYSGARSDSVPSPPYLFVRNSDGGIARSPGNAALKDIGVCWRASSYDKSRSLPPSCLAAWASRGNLISLQKCVTARERGLLRKFGIENAGEAFNDFYDTAKQVSRLDAVVAVDTSVAHLAGAMAKPTLLLLVEPCAPMWRDETLARKFYPTMRFVTKSQAESWAEFMRRSQAELDSLLLSGRVEQLGLA